MHRITMRSIARSRIAQHGITPSCQAPSRLRAVAALGVALAVGVTLAACGSSGGGKKHNPLSGGSASKSVIVGSANFPEDELLATIYQQALEAKGIHVTTKLNIGSREIYYPEIEKGAISIIPDYNGALLSTSVDPTSTAVTTAQVDAALKSHLPSSLEILNPAPAVDSDSVTVTQATAKKDHLTSIAQLGPYAKSWVFGAPSEFKTRADGLPGLKKLYGLTFKSFVNTDESGPITITDLTSGKVQAADVFTTTPQIATDHLVSLADPKHDFAAQNIIPLVYKKDASSKIITVLNEVDSHLTTYALLQMDTALAVQHAGYAEVAGGFLSAIHMG